MTTPHIERMEEELAQLADRTTKLSAFISGNPIFTQMSERQKQLMREQQDAMFDYHDALEERISIEKRAQ